MKLEDDFKLKKTRHKAKTKPQNNDISPEQRLWRQVILVLLQDFQLLVHRHKKSLNGKRGAYYIKIQSEKSKARTAWMKYVCDLADLDHKKLMHVLKKIETGKLVVPHIGRQHKMDID